MIKKKKVLKRAKKTVVKAKKIKRAVVKAKPLKRPTGKKVVAKKTKVPLALSEKVAEVTHYFPKVRVAAVKIMKEALSIGDHVYVKGHTTDFKEVIKSMQLQHEAVTVARKGDEVGILIKSRVRIGDSIYKV